ncbi:DUF4331 family protein [Marivirga lumbricoides]
MFKNIYTILALGLLVTFASCNDDDKMDDAMGMEPEAVIGADFSVDIEEVVNLDASSTTGESVTYTWTVTSPSGAQVSLANATSDMISFTATQEGEYDVTLVAVNLAGTSTAQSTITVINPTYATADQMGRPAINTVFNFFGDADTKNGYNMTTPEDGNVPSAGFKGILDALQTYIGLDPATYTNVLGLDNATTASVLATDVLMSNKNFPSTYGPSNPSDIRLGENVLNGRGLGDDVVDVTLILAFGGDLQNLSATQQGLIGDGVAGNDAEFSATFPYLAPAN